MNTLRNTWIGLAMASGACFALASFPNDVFLGIMPAVAWNVTALFVIVIAATWLLVAILRDDNAPWQHTARLPFLSAFLRWILPPPPAARRAYAQRTRREVK